MTGPKTGAGSKKADLYLRVDQIEGCAPHCAGGWIPSEHRVDTGSTVHGGSNPGRCRAESGGADHPSRPGHSLHGVPLAPNGVDHPPGPDLVLRERGKREHEHGVVQWAPQRREQQLVLRRGEPLGVGAHNWPADGLLQRETEARAAGVHSANELHHPGGDPATASGWLSSSTHLNWCNIPTACPCAGNGRPYCVTGARSVLLQ